jgi:hypothetical protein
MSIRQTPPLSHIPHERSLPECRGAAWAGLVLAVLALLVAVIPAVQAADIARSGSD